MNVDCKVAHGAGNSLHMCPMMPRRLRLHVLARFAQEPRAIPGCAPGWCEVEVAHMIVKLGGAMWIVR